MNGQDRKMPPKLAPKYTAARRKNLKTLVEQAIPAVHWDPSLRRTQSCEYGMTMPIIFVQVRVFAVYTNVFPGSIFEVST